MIRQASAAAVIAIALSYGEAAAQSDEGTSGLWRWFDPRTSPFIPIPEVATDPNSGTSFGVLPIYLVTDEEKQIRKIYAPDVTYHPQLGIGARFRLFGYPSEDTAWYVVGGARQRIEREFDADYTTGIKRTEPWSFSARALYDRSATPRFFGIGNDTTLSERTNYTQEEGYVDAVIARNVTPQLQVSLEMRPRAVTIEPAFSSNRSRPPSSAAKTSGSID
jgi:hypothetical protein